MELAWRIGRYAVAATLLVGVGGSLMQVVELGTFVPWNFFGYFTIQTNMIGIATLVIAARFTGIPRPQWVEYLRASAAAYLAVVATVFWTLLAPASPEYVTWTDYICHLLAAIALVADWLLEGPRQNLPLKRVWIVILYPAVWLAVVLARGATDGWFPYPFLDPAKGYASIAVVVAAIVLIGLMAGAILFALTRWRVIVPPSAISVP